MTTTNNKTRGFEIQRVLFLIDATLVSAGFVCMEAKE